ncbi:hypothetical protein [Rhizobium leguminosarum]|nr:hypothetical protein [Rhizobium leguminosarum]WHO79862.1 hypothetical protein QMO81_002565 [Rhizobium leguminosarum]
MAVCRPAFRVGAILLPAEVDAILPTPDAGVMLSLLPTLAS